MKHYHIWNQGCQMNQADAAQLEAYLQTWGFQPVTSPSEAEVVVMNTCVVRQKAEDRALSQLASLAEAKRAKPQLQVAVTGCLVGPQIKDLQAHFPHVDLFFKPQAFEDFLSWGQSQGLRQAERQDYRLRPTQPVTVIQGCDNFCTYCIVPLRRGREKSRPIQEVVEEAKALAQKGVREVALVGQNVNSYGHDLPNSPGLGELLHALSQIPDLLRLRFLTSHPQDVDDGFIAALTSNDKLCPHISIPVQSGDDAILQAMRRGYSIEEYRSLVAKLRQAIPDIAISTDVIVGFPGEDEEAFQGTLRLIEELRLDTVHIASYSTRPGTWAAKHLRDNIPGAEKKRRQRQLEAVQEAIASESNARLVGREVEILVEDKAKGRWQGRTKQGKWVFFEEAQDCLGRLAWVRVNRATPWWLEGSLLRCK